MIPSECLPQSFEGMLQKTPMTNSAHSLEATPDQLSNQGMSDDYTHLYL